MRITAVHPAAQLVLPLWTNVFSKDHDGILASEQTHCKLLHFLQVLTLLTPFIFDSQRPSMRALHFCSQASITCSPSGCSLTIRFWQLVHGGSDGFSRMSSKSHTVHRIIYIYIYGFPFACFCTHFATQKHPSNWVNTKNEREYTSLSPWTLTFCQLHHLLEELWWLGHMVPQLPEFLHVQRGQLFLKLTTRT